MNENKISGIPYFIDVEKTEENIKTMVTLVKDLFELELYSLPDYKKCEITENTIFEKDMIITNSTKYDDLVIKVLSVFSKLSNEQKRVMYYCYIKNYSLAKLEKGMNADSLVISNAYYMHKKALKFMTTTIQEAIVYREV